MATYPGGYRVWTTKRDFSQTIFASHMNDIQAEVVAGETVFGVNPQIASNNPGHIVRDYGTVGARLQSMIRGEHLPYYQGAVFNYALHTTNQDTNPDVPGQDPDGRDLVWCGTARRQRAKRLRLSGGEVVWMPYHWEVPDRDGHDDPWLGIPLEQDSATVADGGWQRLPFIGADDPFELGIGDGLRLNETGLWMISLIVHHTPDADSTTVRARRRARLEIDGRDVTLQHLVRQNPENASFLTNRLMWMDIMSRGTSITASARVDGTGLTESLPCNAYLRAQLLRTTGREDDGKLIDFPKSIYTPPPPPPPPTPSVPPTPTPGGYTPTPTQVGGGMSGPYAYEARPGEWYGVYGWGTVGPQGSPFFPGIGSWGIGTGQGGSN
ncbi:hypothetical protein [Nonomuraea typhae]|uniref:Minor tail protein n=1 Tax=Nonomuraea typhae TaxID=2603600 RepID=A0ABW7YN26_9ACTN